MQDVGVEIDGASLRRGGRLLFSAVSARVAPGEGLTLRGPNGVGKTSLLRLVAGFLSPAAGAIRFFGEGGPWEDPEERAARIGWLGTEIGLKPQMQVDETLAFYAALFGVDGVGNAGWADVLVRFGLAGLEKTSCARLSSGQRRRLALARLAISGRPVWLLDEPYSFLDAAGCRLLDDVAAAHRAQGGVVLAASHDALPFSDRTLRLEGAP